MKRLELVLSEQLVDQRSAEKTYHIVLENRDHQPVTITSITPRLPDDVKLEEIHDSSSVGLKGRYDDLCRQLAETTNLVTFAASKSFREIYWDKMKELLGRIAEFPLLLRPAVSRTLKRNFHRKAESKAVWQISVTSVADAERAKAQLMCHAKTLGLSDDLINVFDYKLIQLKEAEEKLHSDPSDGGAAIIHPESSTAFGYTLKFPRSLINPRKYSISFDVSYKIMGQAQNSEEKTSYSDSVAESVVISPRPFFLSLIAVVSALAGSTARLLKQAYNAKLESKTDEVRTNADSIVQQLGQVFRDGEIITAAVLALVIFNIYEHLDIGKKFKIGVGWRSALTVGVLCGLFSERLLDALSALVGM